MVQKDDFPEKTFSEGFTDGWQSVRGKGAQPMIPAHSIRAGYTAYAWGYAKGVEEGEYRNNADTGTAKPR